MSQPTDETPDSKLEFERRVEYQNRPILDQLDRIEATLDGVATTMAAAADADPAGPVS